MRKTFSWKYILYVLLFIYICFICGSFYNFTKRMDYLLQTPVRVVQETREMKTRVLEMQNTLPGLLSTPTLDLEDFEEVFNRQNGAQDASFAIVRELFGNYSEEIHNVEEAFENVRKARMEVAKLMIGNANYATAVSQYKKIVAPKVAQVYSALDAISARAHKLMDNTQIRTQKTAFINIVISLVAGWILMLAFIYIDRQEKLRNQEILARDRLFNQLAQNVDQVFIIAKNAKKFDYVSLNSQRLTGLDPKELEDKPQKLYDFLPEDDSKWLKEALSDNKKNVDILEKDVELGDGHRIFKISVYPIIENGVAKKSHIVALHDQTKEYHHQKALHDALENAYAASEAKSNFLSHMSHEIRTPMNAIIGMTTIALNKIDDKERVLDCLGKISESSRHLLGLINDVLDMSKIENGKLAINHEVFSIARNIQNIKNLILPQAVARGINFDIISKVVEENLRGDSLRLNQILLNILSNALKFTPTGGSITMIVDPIKKWQNNVRLRFVIQDTGIGMSKEFLGRLFKPFEQASAQTSMRYGGTGLGMSITFNLVNLMGGSIVVNSQEGKGTTFMVELPFGCSDEQADRHDTLPSMKVLVVDDDKGTCEHASLLLSKMGMNVRTATNGEQAIEMAAEAHDAGDDFDVCFVDWKMPEMDGAETARRLREVVGDKPHIVITSAYDWSSIEDEARARGVNDFIAKPFFASSLYDVLISMRRRQGNDRITESAKIADKKYDFSGKRILLAEDNAFNREIAREFLDMVNITVEDAVNGQEAIDKFNASAPGYYDLIFMDIQMPLIDGYEATKIIRNLNHPDAKTIPILAMTANAFSEDVAKAISVGMNGHIAKPMDIKDLYRLINEHLGH